MMKKNEKKIFTPFYLIRNRISKKFSNFFDFCKNFAMLTELQEGRSTFYLFIFFSPSVVRC